MAQVARSGRNKETGKYIHHECNKSGIHRVGWSVLKRPRSSQEAVVFIYLCRLDFYQLDDVDVVVDPENVVWHQSMIAAADGNDCSRRV